MKIINLNKSMLNNEVKEVHSILSKSNWLSSAISITDFYETLIFSYDEKDMYISISIRNNLYFFNYQNNLDPSSSLTLNYMSFDELLSELKSLEKRQAF